MTKIDQDVLNTFLGERIPFIVSWPGLPISRADFFILFHVHNVSGLRLGSGECAPVVATHPSTACVSASVFSIWVAKD